jgi:hypothetical protein
VSAHPAQALPSLAPVSAAPDVTETTRGANLSTLDRDNPGKTEAKDVTAWLGRRNDAAHGHHDLFTDEQVSLMIEGVRGFISRHPA